MWLFGFAAFGFGAIVGSFLNVFIHRWPREESVVFPPSHCPDCGSRIKPWDNIPILSYIFLWGRCRSCQTRISPRYPLVELANALFYLAVYMRLQHLEMPGAFLLAFVPVAAIISMTIVLIYIDAEIQILPDVVDLPGILIGIVIGLIGVGRVTRGLVLSRSWLDSMLGAAVGAAILLFIAISYKIVRGHEGLGMGDVKYLAMIGAVHGLMSMVGVLLVASLTGALVAIPLALRHERGMQLAIPFGVFLGFGSLVVLFFGATLGRWWIVLNAWLS